MKELFNSLFAGQDIQGIKDIFDAIFTALRALFERLWEKEVPAEETTLAE